jgi:hypothetical protein
MSHQAITTKFLGPTNNRGSRVKATCEAGSVTVGWDYGAGNGTGLSDVEANHDRAALALIRKMGWDGSWVRGGMRNGNVYVCIKRAAHVGYKTPHPQAVDALDLLIVRECES